MSYRFPLTELYRADYNNNSWFFQRPDHRDLYAVSEWYADAVNGSEAWRRRMYRQLLQEFSITEKLPQRSGWMVTIANRRVGMLEVLEARHTDIEVFLIAPSNLLVDEKAAFILWRRAINFLLVLQPWRRLRVHLDLSRDAEARALKKLGFAKDGDWYTL